MASLAVGVRVGYLPSAVHDRLTVGVYDWVRLTFHPGVDTLSPRCKSWTSSGTMGGGRPELLGPLTGGSLFI